MNTLIRIALAAVLVLLLIAPAFPASAQESGSSSSGSLYGNHPGTVSLQNPHAAALARARAALDASISTFWAVYYSRPYDYWATVDAYYAYVNAYYTYRWYLDAYWRHERTQVAFSGFVKTRDLEPGQVVPMIYPYPGHAVAGAQVTLATYVPPGQARPVQLIGTRRTDATGAFRFSGLSSGTYTYSISKAEFIEESGTVEVDGPVTRTIFISKTRTLSGRVRAPQQFGAAPVDWSTDRYPPRPVPGARVSMTYLNPGGVSAQVVHETTTDADGRFRFAGIPSRSVRIVVSATYFRTHSRVVDLARQSAEVDVMLDSALPPPPMAGRGPLGQETVVPGADLNNPFGRD